MMNMVENNYKDGKTSQEFTLGKPSPNCTGHHHCSHYTKWGPWTLGGGKAEGGVGSCN